MCQFKSFIVTKGRVLYLKRTDSHDNILREYGIKDKKPTADFVKVELIPQNGDPAKLKDYIFRIDQDNTPSWWTPEYAAFAEHECRAVLKKIMRRHKTHWPGDLVLREYSKLDFSKIKVVYGDAYLSGCTGLTSIECVTFHGYADLSGCTGLTSLEGVTFNGNANLEGCTGIKSLPEDIEMPGNLYLYETKIEVPASAKIGGRIYR